MKVSRVALGFILAPLADVAAQKPCISSYNWMPHCDSSIVTARPSSNSSRKLSENGVVIHYDPKTMTIPRSEVANALNDALNGGQDFELQENGVDQDGGDLLLVLDLTRNGMEVSMPAIGTSAAFTINNAFVVSEYDIKYLIDCPAEASGEKTCSVSVIPSNGPDEEESICDDLIDVDEKIKVDSKCNDRLYRVGLYYTNGPHFFIGALHHGDVGDDCPAFIAFASIDGKKTKAALKHTLFFNKDSLVHNHLGDVSLQDILKAEDTADALDDGRYDLVTNTCVHYARSIWRSLGLAETTELAEFIIGNTVNDGNFEDMAKSKARFGGLRYLAAKAIGGTDMMEDFVEDIVYSQLDII